MYELTQKLRELEPYQPISGNYRIRLDANESFITIDPDTISSAFVNTALNRYPDPYAASAVNAFADLYSLNPELVTAGNGSDELISIITACFFEKGSKIMCFSNDFSMYAFYPYLYELEVCTLKKNDDLTINIDAAIEAVNKENISAVIFSNPCNPTSLGVSKKDVLRLVKSVSALVILDEAYMDFWDESESLLSDIDKFDNLIILKTCSKALALAGIRLGFAVSSPLITKALRAAKSPYNVNILTQNLAAHILSDKMAVKERIKKVNESIKSLYNDITAEQFSFFERIYPSVTNFVYIQTHSAEKIYDYLLSNSIAVRLFKNHLRISAGSNEENSELISALKKYREL